MLCNKLEQRAQSYLFAKSDFKSVRVRGGCHGLVTKWATWRKWFQEVSESELDRPAFITFGMKWNTEGEPGLYRCSVTARHRQRSRGLNGSKRLQAGSVSLWKPFREGRRLSQQHTNLYCYRIRCSKSTRLLCLDIRTGLGERHPYTVSFVIRNVVVVLRLHCVLSLGSTKWWPRTAWLN